MGLYLYVIIKNMIFSNLFPEFNLHNFISEIQEDQSATVMVREKENKAITQ